MSCLDLDAESFPLVSAVAIAASRTPPWQYAAAVALVLSVVLYNFLEIHILRDLVTAFSDTSVALFYDPHSKVASEILSRCKVLKGRYWSTPWLCSPHLQTAFLHFFGRPPKFNYKREIFLTPDGGTIALDWLVNDNEHQSRSSNTSVNAKEDIPIAIIVPGLTSDSEASYARHIVHALSKEGWKIVVANHRGLGGISITSDRFYNAGWTEDLRIIIKYIQQEHPKAPLFVVGTSIGANIVVKYLGEEGESAPIAGGAAICCPWDLVVCDRFINRKLVQRLYDKILSTGLRSYAHLHQNALEQFADWEGIKKSRSVRDFDHYCTRHTGKFETVDTYYRKCSSAHYLGNVSVPLLCISALDDPVCTKEAIPWDECRVNKNVVLAVTSHGGHLAFFEGFTAHTAWWVRAAKEFLSALHSSSLMHTQKQVQTSGLSSLLESSIDKGPYLNISGDGMLCAEESDYIDPEKVVGNYQLSFKNSVGDIQPSTSDLSVSEENHDKYDERISQIQPAKEIEYPVSISVKNSRDCEALEGVLQQVLDQIQELSKKASYAKSLPNDITSGSTVSPTVNEDINMSSSSSKSSLSIPKEKICSEESHILKHTTKDDESNKPLTIKKTLDKLCHRQRHSFWILAYLAIVNTWPFIGYILLYSFRGRLRWLWDTKLHRK